MVKSRASVQTEKEGHETVNKVLDFYVKRKGVYIRDKDAYGRMGLKLWAYYTACKRLKQAGRLDDQKRVIDARLISLEEFVKQGDPYYETKMKAKEKYHKKRKADANKAYYKRLKGMKDTPTIPTHRATSEPQGLLTEPIEVEIEPVKERELLRVTIITGDPDRIAELIKLL